MFESAFRESFTLLWDICSTPPVSECLWRILFMFLCGVAMLPLAIVLDLTLGYRSDLVDLLRRFLFSPVTFILCMAFCYWPLITEVLTWV